MTARSGIPPTPPKVKVIPAKAIFKAKTQEQEDEFLANGSARVSTKEETSEKPQTIDLGDDKAEKAASASEAETAELESARTAYEAKFGEAANGRMKAETLRSKIADAEKAEAEAAAKGDGKGDDTDKMV